MNSQADISIEIYKENFNNSFRRDNKCIHNTVII